MIELEWVAAEIGGHVAQRAVVEVAEDDGKVPHGHIVMFVRMTDDGWEFFTNYRLDFAPSATSMGSVKTEEDAKRCALIAPGVWSALNEKFRSYWNETSGITEDDQKILPQPLMTKAVDGAAPVASKAVWTRPGKARKRTT